jgi:hypothetical protein
MSPKKADTELYDFEAFQRLCPEIARLSFDRPDPPDFLLENDVGIEHRRLFINEQHGLQISESHKVQIIRAASAAYFGEDNIALDAVFVFKVGNDYTKINRLELGKSIAEFIRKKSRRAKGKRVRIAIEDGLHDSLASIHILEVPDPSYAHWRSANAGWVRQGIRTHIQNAINAKAKKHSSYVTKCRECWLLLTCGHEPSSFMRPTEGDLQHVYTGPFSRLYLLEKSAQGLAMLMISPH